MHKDGEPNFRCEVPPHSGVSVRLLARFDMDNEDGRMDDGWIGMVSARLTVLDGYSCFGRGAERERGEAAQACLNTFDTYKPHLLKRELREI